MKLQLTLFTLLTLSIATSRAHANLTMPIRANQSRETVVKDSVRDDFNIKKKSLTGLIKGKSTKELLSFYGFYLQEKDQMWADSLLTEMLKSDPSVDYRHEISLIFYNYTSDAKTKMLFQSNPDRLKEYRTYFLKYDVSSLKTNKDKRAHYYTLVALDAAYYNVAPDSLVKKQMSHHYNSLAWYSILTKQLDGVEDYINESIKYDPQSKYPYSNRPLLLLLKGHYQEARRLYLKLKDQPFETPGSTFKETFLEDFRELAKEGITSRNITEIAKLLNSKL